MPSTPRFPDPAHPRVERRRRRRGAISKLLTTPIPSERIASRARQAVRSVSPLGVPALVLALALTGAWLGYRAWSRRTPVLEPRHRAEALCFALAQRPAFAPPMAVESGAALVRGRFSERTPTGLALRQTMGFSDDMVIRERTLRIGDYDIAQLWLRLPASSGGRHWLILAWMEEADLAISSFRFEGDGTDLSPDEVRWGNRLLQRVLVPDNFRAGSLPAVRVRAARGAAPPRFGPKPQDG